MTELTPTNIIGLILVEVKLWATVHCNFYFLLLATKPYTPFIFGEIMIMFTSTLVTPATDVSPDTVMFSLVEETAASCRTKSKKQLKEVEDAQLAAHR